MARMTISIPDDVKKRIDRLKEPVNWSSVAAEAFELKLGEFARKQKEKTMETVIARLRASKIQGASAIAKEGQHVGYSWAKDDAEFDELRRLAKIDYEFFDADWDNSAWGADTALHAKLTGNEDFDRQEASEFWDGILGDGHEAKENRQSIDFLRGFVAGALEVFEEVKDKL